MLDVVKLPEEFLCPHSMTPHAMKVFCNEYDFREDIGEKLVILDIGANIGAFSVWAASRWPDSIIHAYEPIPENFELLKHNVLSQGLDKRVFTYNYAIGKCDSPTVDMYYGRSNCGEATIFKELETANPDHKISVPIQDPIVLPQANILKIDTEGSELYILTPLLYYRKKFDVILIEYHREEDRKVIDQMLADYVLIAASVSGPGLGLVKYLHKDIFERLTSHKLVEEK